MRARLLLVLLVLVPALPAQERREVAVSPVSVPATSVATKATIRKTLDREGTFVPADAAEVRIDLKSWRGDLTAAEAVPHGSFVNEGDVIVLPAGTGHRKLESSSDFLVVGAYPPGFSADLLRGEPGERPGSDERIARVPLPRTDPVGGQGGPVLENWR